MSTDYKLILDEKWKNYPKGAPFVHIAICASTAEKDECKMLDELFDLQLLEIFKAYTFEQMKLSLVIREESDEYKDNELSMNVGLESRLFVYKCRKFLLNKEIQSVRKKERVKKRMKRQTYGNQDEIISKSKSYHYMIINVNWSD